MVAPTIKDHAQDHVKAKYLPAMYRADLVGCQLFSEPGAGSDLAGLQTKAERDGDEWIITGQKVWTSGAQYSDIGEIICPHRPRPARSTRASPASSSTCTPPASRCGRCAR